MKPMLLLLLMPLLLSACAPATKPTWEQVGVREVKKPPAACGPVQKGALVNGIVTIKPGQTICIELRKSGTTVEPVALVTIKDPATTLMLRSWVEPGTSDTYLVLQNPLDKRLLYKAHMRVSGAANIEYTSTCPVLSRRMAIEHWPYLVSEFVLSDFVALPESESIQCM